MSSSIRVVPGSGTQEGAAANGGMPRRPPAPRLQSMTATV